MKPQAAAPEHNRSSGGSAREPVICSPLQERPPDTHTRQVQRSGQTATRDREKGSPSSSHTSRRRTERSVESQANKMANLIGKTEDREEVED
ncbi:phosphomannomutase [Anopheles sinensis]|uniref:Phosphomannomutase n=1 Tax=Anopheles sinensis TaxID=74873 RepID=A0A084W7J2_ANOSI|nr:phosphomannomutase [Anopheles sinensis]